MGGAYMKMNFNPRCANLHDMNDSSEIRSLTNSIAGLVSAITGIINAKVEAANTSGGPKASLAATSAAPGMPPNQSAPSEIFIEFRELRRRIPLCERSLREAVRCGRIPSIRLPGARRVLFHWNSVQAALLRLQRGAQE